MRYGRQESISEEHMTILVQWTKIHVTKNLIIIERFSRQKQKRSGWCSEEIRGLEEQGGKVEQRKFHIQQITLF